MSQPQTPTLTPENNPPKIIPTNKHRLAVLLFLLSLVVYLFTRLIRLPDFPIYFFTDEAVQTQQAADLVQNGCRDAGGVLLPTYFENGGQYNLSLSVYAQVLPTLVFGKSIWVTRGVSALLTLAAAVSLGLILKNCLKTRWWWLGPLLLAATPAWFLHSRTAFETVIMASLYAAFLYCYLRYRQKKPRMLYPALIFGALAFYSYSPGQVIIVVTGLMLLVADARYHWQHRKTALLGLLLLIVLALPYLRFSQLQSVELQHHLTVLGSYWVKPAPIWEKILAYLVRYAKGFNPFYWFAPNPPLISRIFPEIDLPNWLYGNLNDLARHTMKGWGHLLPLTLPFWLIGLVRTVRRFRDPAHRTLLLASLAAPSGAAVVDWGITRGLAFIIPAILLIALGLEVSVNWLMQHWQWLKPTHLSAALFLLLSGVSGWMLADALKNGPTWYEDYGLAGMQYGAQQVFRRAAQIAQTDPETKVLVSSTWANGTDVLMRFFVDDMPNVRMGNINAFGQQYQPLDRSLLFVMTEEDLDYIEDSGKFTNVTVEETLPYPDGRPGFYFVRLDYVPDIEEILVSEQAQRQALRTEFLNIKNQDVQVQFPMLDMNEISHAFDGDPTTVIRTLEANPLRLILTFPKAIEIHQVNLLIGGTPTRATVTASRDGEKLATQAEQVGSDIVQRELTLSIFPPVTADQITLEILNTHDGEIAHVHLWEVTIE